MGDAQGGVQRSGLKLLLWGEPPDFGRRGGNLPPTACHPEGETAQKTTSIHCCAYKPVGGDPAFMPGAEIAACIVNKGRGCHALIRRIARPLAARIPPVG
jgi:hypothetical protein